MAEAQQEVVRKQTELAELEAQRKEKELLSTTVKPAAANAQAVIATAEGAKRARIASAEADAETTRLEGGAEAQIVLTKGEAEAKALAMRADAYKQFNEAAIIQTVLAALPDIVRAAAEPMSKIDSLTVMSADGASDLVKNATRAVVESTTAIKGLTGLDVPGLVGNALGRGFVDRGDGHTNDKKEESALDKINSVAKEGLTTMPARVEQAAAAAHAEVKAATEQAQAKVDAAKKAVEDAKKAATTVEAKAAAVANKVVPGEGTILQWAQWTADQLRQVPTIELFSTLKLSALIDHGPPQAEAIWHTAQAALGRDYGDLTVGDLLKRFGPKS